MRPLLFSLAFLVLAPPAVARPGTAAPAAEVLATEGTVALEPMHSGLEVGTKLAEGDRVTVMKASKLRLRLAGGQVAELGADSELLLKRNADRGWMLRLPHGSLWLAAPAGSSLEVRTGELRFEVGAQAVFLRGGMDHPSLVCVREGKVAGRGPGGEGKLEAGHEERCALFHPSKASAEPAEKPASFPAEVKRLRALL
jgi:hypothetical protein